MEEDVSKYAHSPAHLAVARRDHVALRRLILTLPRLPEAEEVITEEESIASERAAEAVSAVIDRRDVPKRETPLHLAVRLRDPTSVEILMSAGASGFRQNANGWSAFDEALWTSQWAIAMIIKCHSDPLSQAKLCRRFPRIVASISRIRDFYMEITFHFESSVIPFVGRIFPSDTYRIWKRGSNIRLDMTFAGYDGFRIKRTDQSFLFLGKGKGSEVLPGSLVVLEHKKKEISIALKGPTARGIKPVVVEENARKVAVMSQYISTGKIDVQEAELVPHLNWRRQERTEMIGSWKGKMYDMRNVTVNMKARTVPIKVAHEELSVDHKEDGLDDVMTMEERKQFEAALKMGLEGNYEDFDNGEDSSKEKKSWSGGNNKKASKAIGEKHNGNVKSKKGKEDLIDGKKHKGKNSEKKKKKNGVMDDSDKDKGDGLNIGVTPVLWLTPDFPLKIDELLPLLDVLVNKVKAMRRLRELLAAKLPQGTFPVKVAIPLHTPIVRIVITFTKFEEFSVDSKAKDTKPSGSWYSWARGQFISSSKDETDPFSIPQDYTWIDANERKTRKKANKVKNEQNESAVSGLNRGLAASEEDLKRAESAAKELEGVGIVVDLTKDLDKLQGRWKLLYSSAFSSRTLGGSRPGPPIGRLLPITLRQVFQRIDILSKDFDNIVDLQFGTPWPLPPVEATATLAHKFELIGTSKIKITFEKTTVKATGNLSQLPPLEVPRLPDALRPPSNTGSGEFEVTYLDADTRITRGDRAELRVFVIS